jgi:hypothetical protein
MQISRRKIVGGALALASISNANGASPSQTIEAQARTDFAFEAYVTVGKPLVIGTSARGLRRVVPITGGTVRGPKFNGRVVPGGADWQVVRPDDVLDVEAKYTLEAEDGTLIMVTNKGVRHGPKAIIEKMARGESVDPSEYYFRTSAQFEAPSESKHAWLNRSVFIGVAERKADAAVIRFYEVL